MALGPEGFRAEVTHSNESSIVVDFFPSGESVRMVVTLDPMHDEEFTKMLIMGFASQIKKLDKRFVGLRFR